jgi:hypothetical protein
LKGSHPTTLGDVGGDRSEALHGGAQVRLYPFAALAPVLALGTEPGRMGAVALRVDALVVDTVVAMDRALATASTPGA